MFPLVVNLPSENLFPGVRRQLPAQEGRHCVHPSDGCENFRILEFTDIWEQTNAFSSKLVKSWFFHQSCSQVTEEGGTWTIKTSTTLKTMELKFKVRNIFQRLHHTTTYDKDKDKDIDVHHLEDLGAQVKVEKENLYLVAQCPSRLCLWWPLKWLSGYYLVKEIVLQEKLSQNY